LHDALPILERGADITVGCIEVPLDIASAFGLMEIDEDRRIVSFDEKPPQPKPMIGRTDVALASMGIYVFSTDVLFRELLRDKDTPGSSHDFGKDIIPAMIKDHNVMAFPFRDPISGGEAYWRDVGTIDALWEANLELIGVSPELDLYDESWPIWTHQEQVPPAKFVFNDENRRGLAVDSMIAGGCIVSGSAIRHSLLFPRVRVHSFSEISDSVIFPNVEIGRNCRIHKALIDRYCKIPDGMVIGHDLDADRKRFHVSPKGVVLVTPEMLDEEYPNVR